MKTKQTRNAANEAVNEMDAEVLYQRLGDRWFAFSLIGDEVFMSPVDDEIIEGIRADASAANPIPNETI
jgi:hypothetical protein